MDDLIALVAVVSLLLLTIGAMVIVVLLVLFLCLVLVDWINNFGKVRGAMLKTILTSLYLKCLVSHKEELTYLRGGLAIRMRLIGDMVRLEIIRGHNQWPSDTEFSTVLKHLPFQVFVQANRRQIGHNCILFTDIPVQETLFQETV